MSRRLPWARSAWLVSSFLATGVLAVAACSEEEDPVVFFATADGAADGTTSPVSAAAWGNTPCATCTREKCLREVTRCRSEPTCARRFECVQACPTASNGEPDPACAEACPPATGSAGERAWSDLEHCRENGPGALCQECPANVGKRRSPLLNQSCENPTWDAGPDASAERESCQRCGAQRCCESRDRCRADEGCRALDDCAAECPTPDCIDQCYAAHDASVVGKWSEKLNCHAIQCPSECGVPPNACEDCLTTHCASERIECAANGDCWLLMSCIGKCNLSTSCADDCRAKHPAGEALLDALNACAFAKCPQCL